MLINPKMDWKIISSCFHEFVEGRTRGKTKKTKLFNLPKKRLLQILQAEII